MPAIPKIIHFIWAGGTRPMPIENQQRILEWAKKYPDFKIHVWVDYKTAEGDSLELREQAVRNWYKALISKAGKDLDGQDRIILKDVDGDLYNTPEEQREELYKYFRYEIGRLRPNYGASSDLLRYKILHKFGGAYFDSDVLPGKLSLESGIEFGSIARDCLWVNGSTQGIKDAIGNDAFVVTTQGNPVMLSILDMSIQNYRQMKDVIEKSCLGGGLKRCFPGSYDSYSFLSGFTPNLTGPGVVEKLVSPIIEAETAKGAEDRSVKNLTEYISLPCYDDSESGGKQTNDGNWLRMPLQYKGADPDIVLFKIVESDCFELVNMNMWRINDSFYNYYELTGKCLDLNEYIKRMEERLHTSLGEFLKGKLKEGVHIQDLLTLEDKIAKDRDIDFFCTESMGKILERYAVSMINLNLIDLKQYGIEKELIAGERNDLLPAIVAKGDGTFFDVMYVDSDNTVIRFPLTTLLTEEDCTKTKELFEEHKMDLRIGGGFASIALPATDRMVEKFSAIFPVATEKSIAAIDIKQCPTLVELNQHAKEGKETISRLLPGKSSEQQLKKV